MRANAFRKKIKIVTGVMIAAIIVIAAALTVFIAGIMTELNVRYVPSYEKINLGIYRGIMSGNLSEEDYELLFRQTGLGRAAVDSIFNAHSDPVSVLEIHQYNFFSAPMYMCRKIGMVTREERLYDEDGNVEKGFLLADVRDGDILITKATHTLGWRHGHAGIVTDAQNGETLEAVFWGRPTMLQSLSKWQVHPTFIQLRLRNPEIGAKAAAFARENLMDINYSLWADLFTPQFENEVRSTHCAHLPWYVYLYFGYDISANRGLFVTPRGIVNSEYLEIVQIFGVNPDRIW